MTIVLLKVALLIAYLLIGLVVGVWFVRDNNRELTKEQIKQDCAVEIFLCSLCYPALFLAYCFFLLSDLIKKKIKFIPLISGKLSTSAEKLLSAVVSVPVNVVFKIRPSEQKPTVLNEILVEKPRVSVGTINTEQDQIMKDLERELDPRVRFDDELIDHALKNKYL